ncbi:MAG: phenylalanine--tRNA ligase beta subunit-related protein [Thaumarchaeota archaeon]|nr:phenylalanine--tRNA ligase beta subunit-related protein [Nitrososphaerota archaeon]
MEIIQGLSSSFPGLRVVELRMTGLTVKGSDPELESFKLEVQGRVRERTASLDEVKNQPIFRAYRDFFWRVGIDPTKLRPAGEALTRRILAGRDLPRINTLVDAYNLVSVETSIAIAAFDAAKVTEGELVMRKSVVGEPFHGIGMASPDSLSGSEIVIEDIRSGKLIAVYPYRDSDETKVNERTEGVLFMMCGVPGIDDRALEAASRLTREYVGRFCGASG